MQKSIFKSILRGSSIFKASKYLQALPNPYTTLGLLYISRKFFNNQSIKHPEEHYHNHDEHAIKQKIMKDASLFKALISEGQAHLSKKKFIEAEKALTKALEISLKIFGEQNQVTGITLFTLANLFKEKGENDKAKQLFKASFEVLIQDPAKNKETLNRIEKALESFEIGSKDQNSATEKRTKEALLKEIQSAKSQKKSEDLQKLYSEIAKLYLEEQNIDQALSYKELSLNLCEQLYANEKFKLFQALFDTGLFYKDARKYRDSLVFFFKGMQLVETEKGDEAERFRFLALHNLGRVYVLLKEYGEALEYFIKAIKIKEKRAFKDDVVISGLYQEIGLVYFFLKKGREAVDQFEKSLALKEGLKDRIGIARVSQQIAEAHLFLLKDLKTAKNYFLKTLELRKDIYGEAHAETESVKKALKFIDANLQAATGTQKST